jgi:hypothetical protein
MVKRIRPHDLDTYNNGEKNHYCKFLEAFCGAPFKLGPAVRGELLHGTLHFATILWNITNAFPAVMLFTTRDT